MLDWEPKTAGEIIYIDQIVQSYFLSRRAISFMQDAYDASTHNGEPVSETYPVFMRIKTQNDRVVHRSLEALTALKKAREKVDQTAAPAVPDAAALPETEALPETANQSNDLAENGFVPPTYEPAPDHCRQIPSEPYTPMGELTESS